MTIQNTKDQLIAQTHRFFATEPFKKLPKRKRRRLERQLIRERA